MADSFYDVKGNEISKEMIVAEFINNYTGSLTDFNEGSEIRNLIEAFAVYAMGLEERINDTVYIMDVSNADGEYLDLLASQPQINMERIEGVEATGIVVFTIKTALLEELLIPAGTVVTSDTGLDFETVTDNIIQPGELSRECMVQAIDVGVDGNIPANSILTKIDGYDAVDGFTVSNPEPFMGGWDYEEDDAFRERILAKLSLTKFGSKPYYVSMLMNEFPEAHDILFDTDVQGYNAVVTPNTYKGSTAQAKLESDVAGYLTNENNVSLGHTFDVASPTVQNYSYKFGGSSGQIPSGIDFLIVLDRELTVDETSKANEIINAYIMGGSVEGFSAPLEFRGLNLNERVNDIDLKEAIGLLGVEVKYFLKTPFSSTEYYFDFSLNGKNKYDLRYKDD